MTTPTRQTQFIDFPDMGFNAKFIWDYNQKRYEITSGTTYIGTANSIEDGKVVARNWFNELLTA